MRLHNKITGAVRWWALGDSLWLAVETQSHEEIAKKFWSVSKFLPIKTNKFFANAAKRWEFEGDVNGSGYISDDTILTLAWLQSLINRWKLDIIDLFKEQNNFLWAHWKIWFGKATLASLRKFNYGASPMDTGQLSWWNGVMMKQFPYALYYHLHPDNLDSIDLHIDQITSSTHTSLIARTAVIVHNRMLMKLLALWPDEKINRNNMIEELRHVARDVQCGFDEAGLKQNADEWYALTNVLSLLRYNAHDVENWSRFTLQQIVERYKIKGKDKKAKYWFHVASTFGFVYAIFMQNPNRQWLLDAINIGEDTDTQASIIWNMIGAYQWEFYDKSLIEKIQKKDEIAAVLQGFTDKFLS